MLLEIPHICCTVEQISELLCQWSDNEIDDGRDDGADDGIHDSWKVNTIMLKINSL